MTKTADELTDEQKAAAAEEAKTKEAADLKKHADESEETPAFDLAGATEEAQQTAAALGEQLLAQSEGLKLSGEVLEFAKSAAALKKETSAVEVAKSVLGIEVVKAITDPLEKQVVELQKSIEDMQTEKTLSEMVAAAREIEPDADEAALQKSADKLVKLQSALSPAEFEEHLREAKATSVQLRKSALFDRVASNRGMPGGSASDQIETLTVELTKGGKSQAEAIDEVAHNNPELWAQYQQEVRYRDRAVVNGTGGN